MPVDVPVMTMDRMAGFPIGRGELLPGPGEGGKVVDGVTGPGLTSKQAGFAIARASRGSLGGQAVVPHIDGVTESRMSLAPSIKERRPWSIMQESTCHWNGQASA